MNNILTLFIIISVLILLPGVQFAPKKDFFDNLFPLTVTKGMQGYLAFLVLFHQLSFQINKMPLYKGRLDSFSEIGVLIVGFYFFFSGYGLIVSVNTKKEYLKTFLIRRVFTVLVPFFLCNYAYMVTTLLCGNQYSTKQLILAFFGVILLNDHMWFAVEIMLLYVVFFLLFTYVPSKKLRFLFMGLFVTILIIVSFLLGHNMNSGIQMNWLQGEWWYNTTLLFYLGMLFAETKEQILPFVKKHYISLVFVFTVLFLLFWKLTGYMLQNHGYWTETKDSMGYLDKLMTFSVQLPAVICFEILLLLLFMKVHFQNRTLEFLGKISLEVILIEKVFMLLLEDICIHGRFRQYIILTVFLTILSATLINHIKLIVLEKK